MKSKKKIAKLEKRIMLLLTEQQELLKRIIELEPLVERGKKIEGACVAIMRRKIAQDGS